MKNRNTIVVAFLLCAVLLLGVGYAAIADVLDITGSADVTKANAQASYDADVYFTNAEIADGNVENTTSINADNNDKVSFTAKNLKGQGDTAKFTYTIYNGSDVDANVTPSISSNTAAEYFGLSSDWNAQPKLIKAGQSMTYTVTVTLLKTPTFEEMELLSGSFIIELTAVAQEANP